MGKFVLAASVALAAMTATAQAADLDREIGLIVSGVVDQWAGVQFIDDGFSDDTVFASGGEGRLSLPIGSNLSIQTDAKYEYNSNAFENALSNDVNGPRFSYQFATHASFRNPSQFLLGAFGGVGSNDIGLGYGTGSFRQDHRFAGGEVQFYMNDFTVYAQGGYVETGNLFQGLDDGFFARGVLRYFPTAESRLQVEGTYINMDIFEALSSDMDMEAFIVKARYDTTLELPLIGSTPLYLAYRGTFRNNCGRGLQFGRLQDLDDHTFMIGTSYSFSGDMLTIDRQGATLDTPDFVACYVEFG